MKKKIDSPEIPINKGQFTLEASDRIAEFDAKRGFGVETEFKENRRLWTELAKEQRVSDYPLHVDIELSSICNLRCPMCYTISDEFKQRVKPTLMDYDLYTRIIDECASGGVYSIRLSFRGEPFLHKRILDCIKYAKDKGINEVSSLTNGVKLNEQLFSLIMDAGMDWLTISFDGVGETYERIRYPAKYERAVEKIRNYCDIKKKAGKVKPVVKVQSILPAIESSPEEYYEIFSPITDMVSANPLIDFSQSKRDLPKLENYCCPQIYQRLVIGADGVCMMCTNDENGEIQVGDMNKQSVHEVWHGKEMTHIRDIHRRFQGPQILSPCAECYLPLKTYDVDIDIGNHSVIAEKYLTPQKKQDQDKMKLQSGHKV